MSSELAIRVKELSKLYRLGRRESYKRLRDALTDALYSAFRRLGGKSRAEIQTSQSSISESPLRHTQSEFIWALKDVSFEVRRGEVLGIIGPNGAGKTTLLKILSRITEPTEGYAEIHGRVGSLLEVGTGFHPELTGRENIYLNGAILGMRYSEIESKFDEIVEFSGLERFIDTPVKHYSSGMYIRLAFGVAAHLDPEILLVDEVLAVGDAAFQEKCVGKMSQIAGGGRTVVFVSHNMAAIRNLCSRVLLIEDGQLRFEGTSDDTIQTYLAGLRHLEQHAGKALADRRDRSGCGSIRVVDFHAQAQGHANNAVLAGSDAEFIVSYIARQEQPVLRVHVAIVVVDRRGVSLFSFTTGMTRCDFRDVAPSGRIVCKVRNLPLIPGQYWVNIMLKDDSGLADFINGAASFRVIDGGAGGILDYPSPSFGGSVIVPHEWRWLPTSDHVTRGRRDGE